MTLDLYSWGFRRNMRVSDVMDIHTLLSTLVETIRFIFTVYVGQTEVCTCYCILIGHKYDVALVICDIAVFVISVVLCSIINCCFLSMSGRGSVVKVMDLHPASLGSTPTGTRAQEGHPTEIAPVCQ